MDRLWALKTDYEPFRRLMVPPAWFHLFRCTSYRCPYCHWIFKITWGPSNSLLGTGERVCCHCKTLFWDGSQEWPEMSGDDQRLFLLPITVVGFVGAFILILALPLWTSFFLKRPTRFRYDLFFMVFGIPMLLWFAIRGWQVNRSIHRYNDRVKR